MWALYNHISKSMPPLTKHWNQLYPDAKAEMIEIVKEIKELNEAHRASQRNQNKTFITKLMNVFIKSSR